ncbi:MAG: hypothetical protein KKF56_05080 [Nanoarchaeota archaeon]|nr:hypothetical protein [Nanoarchaeota archaeon]
MSRWFSDRNVSGYNQIMSRVEWLRKDGCNVSDEEHEYELRIIYCLLEQIPNDDTRRTWVEKVDKMLEGIVSPIQDEAKYVGGGI